MEGRDARGTGRAAAFVCDDSTRIVSMGDTLSQVATQGATPNAASAENTETNASGGAYDKDNGR